jgi:hypothetical protein
MRLTAHECYGFAVQCWADPAAAAVVQRFFGPQRPAGPDGAVEGGGSRLQISVEVRDRAGPAPATPSYFPAGWDRDDPIAIDLGRSEAEISPAARTIRVGLHPADLTDPIVWGRWLLEKAFLITVLRSERHYGLHAGAMTLQGRSVLVAADSGVGKSTFVAWALRHGAGFAGDDAMIRHLADVPGAFWGYPRAAYLSQETIAGWPELAGAPAAPVPGRDKARVEWPPVLAARLASRVRPAAMLFLTREHHEVRRLDVGQAADRCREDYTAGKTGAAARQRVEEDLRAQLASLRLVDFGLTADLDRNLATLTELLEAVDPVTVPPD